MSSKHRPSTFGGTWRPARRNTMYRSLKEARSESSFDQGAAPGCLLIMAGTVCAGVLALLAGCAPAQSTQTSTPEHVPAATSTQGTPPGHAPEARTRVLTSRAPVPAAKPEHKAPVREHVTVIRGYVNCTGHAQECIDRGSLTMYNGNYLAGHNYMGWDWLDALPVGRTVRITTGPLAGTYRVFGHTWTKRASQGGTFPDSRGAAVVLQTCTSNGTGYSLLRRA